jgi:hypothetical protein
MNEVYSRPARIRLIRDPEASDTIRRANDEAGTFLGFAFTFYTIQLTLAAANLVTDRPTGPWYYVLPLLAVSDFLTGVFALAAIARFDLGFEIARIYKPWPTVREILDQEKLCGDWFPRWWFKLEEALAKQVPPSQQTTLTRLLERVAPFRQALVLSGLALIVSGTNFFALRGVAI